MSEDLVARLERFGRPRVAAVEMEGEIFHVRGMGSIERAIFLQCVQDAALERSQVPDHTIVALGLCNEDGTPVTDDRPALILRLACLDGKVLHALAQKTVDLSGFGAKAVEKAEKN